MNKHSNPAPQRAAFSFEDYKFNRFSIEFEELKDNESLGIDFIPSGEYDAETGLFRMTLNFIAVAETSHHPIIKVECVALFKFGQPLPIEELPDYFFTNSTAILYPYIRAFVSTLTLQANYNAFVLPTLNVALLGERLKADTVERSVSEKIG